MSGGSNTIELRAARYFGLHPWPRTTIRLGRHRVLLVAETNVPGVKWINYYAERYRDCPASEVCWSIGLDTKQVAAVMEALR